MKTIKIPDKLFFRIGDVARLLGVKTHVLRYWESEFPVLSPPKSAAGQRVYRRSDVETLVMIRHLLHEERYSIEGARRRIRELRKEGELKEFKKGGYRAAASADTKQLREALEDLKALTERPISDFFQY